MAMTVRPSQDGGHSAFGMPCGRRVQQRRGLVEDQGVGVGEDDACQCQLLGLSAVQPVASRAQLRVESVRQAVVPSPRRPRPGPPSRSVSGADSAAMRRLSRTVPRKTWCSWVTRTT